MTAYQFEFRTIRGEALPLSSFEGQPVLVVNTASQCGLTPQYRELQGLWERYKGKGLVVLGVPSNDFGAQEPGTETEIVEFCEVNYSIDFPMTEKQVVIGGEAHPFYQWVMEIAGEDAAPKWNFHKYLIGPEGELVNVFPSKMSPLDAAIVDEIERLLGA
ncbi:glutathione peroxidase [Parvibaculum sp.]|uniref:glutathione peroxidase n=1 Tax=Parvibaculum sp. TaxID=2024848 RepID=UPI000C8AAAA6|nr:glutathione peroxidase [Parvibaculum sp.]MAB13944.1 glutathione peroxidase [Parvibaculum sp.]|tara:strand:+ start:113 stop:592 length:480 start_codon:yes stop_codon:yes gene_type:complete